MRSRMIPRSGDRTLARAFLFAILALGAFAALTWWPL